MVNRSGDRLRRLARMPRCRVPVGWGGPAANPAAAASVAGFDRAGFSCSL